MKSIVGVACVFCSKIYDERRCPVYGNSRDLSSFFCYSYEKAEQFNNDKEVKETVFDVVNAGEILDD